MKFALALVAAVSASCASSSSSLGSSNKIHHSARPIKISDVRTRSEGHGGNTMSWTDLPVIAKQWNGPTKKGCIKSVNGGVSGDKIEVGLKGGRQSVSHVHVFTQPTFDTEGTLAGAIVLAGWRQCGSLTKNS